MAIEVKTEDRKMVALEVKGKEYQRDAKTGAIVLSFPRTAMKTEDEVARTTEKEKEKPKANADTHA